MVAAGQGQGPEGRQRPMDSDSPAARRAGVYNPLPYLGTWESCLINAAALLGGLLSPLHRRAN